MTVLFEFDARELSGLTRQLQGLGEADFGELVDSLAMEGESQTRRRIEVEKESPSGDVWVEWSDRYAKTRHAGQSLVESEGGLVDSIESGSRGGDVYFGSDLIYAASMQYGDDKRGIPAREYVGFSRDNKRDLEAIMESFLANVLA